MRRNDPAQYDQLADHWWEPTGGFAMLHWLAASRAEHVPPATGPDAVLVDLACGGGLMAPHAARLGYRHVGVDLNAAALAVAARHGVLAVRGSVLAEAARLLRPGGTLVVDAIAATRLASLVAVRIAERVPGGPPPGIHDPALFVDRRRLLAAADRLGLDLRLVGLRPSVRDLLAWRRGRRDVVRMRALPTTAVLFAGYGRKREPSRPPGNAGAPQRRAAAPTRTVGA